MIKSIRKSSKGSNSNLMELSRRSNRKSNKGSSSNLQDLSRRNSEAACDDHDHTDSSSRGFVPLTVEKHLDKLYNAKLAPLDLKFDMVREEETTVTLKKAHRSALRGQIINASRKARASVLFVVKRPGCILCHEQGHDLAKLIDEFPAQSVAAFACVKEINVDNEGLLTLYNNYFNFPFYRDTRMRIYQALGDRKVNVPKALLMYPFIKKRWESKGLKGNMIGDGEGMILGGIMIFNRRGELQYAYQEKFGMEIPVDEIRDAINDIIN